MPLAAVLGPVGRVGAGVKAALLGAAGGAVDDGTLQVEQAAFAQDGQQVAVGLVEGATGGPLAEAAPAGGAGAAAHPLGQRLPAEALPEDEEDAAQAVAV